MEGKNLAPHEPVVREGAPTPSNATAEPAAATGMLPCPWCGGPGLPVEFLKEGSGSRWHRVICEACEVIGPEVEGRSLAYYGIDPCEAEAVTAWNTRPSPARDEGGGTMGMETETWALFNPDAWKLRPITYGSKADADEMAVKLSDGHCRLFVVPLYAAPVSAPGMAAPGMAAPRFVYSNVEPGDMDYWVAEFGFNRKEDAEAFRRAASTGQGVASPADGSTCEPSTTGAGRQIIPTDDQGGEGT